MVLSKSGLRALGLCALALGLMAAFTSSRAQAEADAAWTMVDLGGSLLKVGVPSDTLLPKINVKEIETLLTAPALRHVVLLSEALKMHYETRCTGAALEDEAGAVGVRLLLTGSLEHGKVKFTNCIEFLKGVESKACTPKTNGGPLGVILTGPLKGLIVLHELASGEKDELIRVEPLTGEKIVTLETGEECSIGESIPIIGRVFLKDSQNEFLVEKEDHLFELGPLTELWGISKTAEHVATLKGSALVALIGMGHVGLRWGGTPK